MTRQKFSSRLMATAALGAMLLGSAPAFAEDTAPASSTPTAPAAIPAPAAALAANELPADLGAWLDAQERLILVRALDETGFNRTAAAARLGLNLRQMRYRMARLGITAPSNGEADDDGA